MSTQAELYAKAKHAKTLAPVKAERWEPKEKGQMLIGLLREKQIKHSDKYDTDFVLYTFQSDEGAINWIPGKATDAMIGSIIEVGQLYAITFGGKEDVGKGNPMNVYTVDLIPLDVDE